MELMVNTENVALVGGSLRAKLYLVSGAMIVKVGTTKYVLQGRHVIKTIKLHQYG